MGRGRAKAKQTKVARALKYAGPETDLERLQRELAANGNADSDSDDEAGDGDVDDEDDDVEADPYAKYYDDEDEDTAHSA